MRKISSAFWTKHGIDPGVPAGNTMTVEQFGTALLRTIRAMSPDEKAHVRAKLARASGIVPKSSDGRPC